MAVDLEPHCRPLVGREQGIVKLDRVVRIFRLDAHEFRSLVGRLVDLVFLVGPHVDRSAVRADWTVVLNLLEVRVYEFVGPARANRRRKSHRCDCHELPQRTACHDLPPTEIINQVPVVRYRRRCVSQTSTHEAAADSIENVPVTISGTPSPSISPTSRVAWRGVPISIVCRANVPGRVCSGQTSAGSVFSSTAAPDARSAHATMSRSPSPSRSTASARCTPAIVAMACSV